MSAITRIEDYHWGLFNITGVGVMGNAEIVFRDAVCGKWFTACHLYQDEPELTAEHEKWPEQVFWLADKSNEEEST
jgi:hypothetical protein